jgi:hypothetical protein
MARDDDAGFVFAFGRVFESRSVLSWILEAEIPFLVGLKDRFRKRDAVELSWEVQRRNRKRGGV